MTRKQRAAVDALESAFRKLYAAADDAGTSAPAADYLGRCASDVADIVTDLRAQLEGRS